MATTTRVAGRFWMDLNGWVVCEQHAGYSLGAAIRSRPGAKTHRTDITVWERLTRAEVTELAALVGRPSPCEAC
jgi:hypothetical protein